MTNQDFFFQISFEKADSFFPTVRGVAQQQLALSRKLEAKVAGRLEDEHDPSWRDPSFVEMFQILNSINRTSEENVYHQAQRDEWAVKNNLFHRVTADIVLVSDAKEQPIDFQLSKSVEQLLGPSVQEDIIKSFKIYSRLHPVPLVDRQRHGIHWSRWLVERPDLDFRTLAGEPSGAYHLGHSTMTGHPLALDGDGPYRKADSGERIQAWPLVIEAQEKLRYGALGACTGILGCLLKIIDPKLHAEYEQVCRTFAEFKAARNEEDHLTRRKGDLFMMRALLINVHTTDHLDKSDWKYGFAGLVIVGDWEGADLLLRQLGLQISAPPGTAQLMRGGELRHSTTTYRGTRALPVCVIPQGVRKWAEDLKKEADKKASSTQDNNGSNKINEDTEQTVGQSEPTKKRKRAQS